jgi:hypothetical protein
MTPTWEKSENNDDFLRKECEDSLSVIGVIDRNKGKRSEG